jgi:pimeloyl-ACP methyl ester carboxylesterase
MALGKDPIGEYCAPGVFYEEKMVPVKENVSLRVITFTPPVDNDNPAVIFVPGWISLLSGWKRVLKEMTKDFLVYYIETREKITSRVKGKVAYSVEAIGGDIVDLVSQLKLKPKQYILFGSSLGGTVLLDCCRFLKTEPLFLVLIGPNAVFRVPKFGMAIIRPFYPGLYLILKPFIKWYLKTFRLDVKTDYAQYKKYCDNLDTADPWKLKKAAISFSKYQVWDKLEQIKYPTLIVGASKDLLHEPLNLKKMVSMIKDVTYLDLETNKATHSAVVVEEMRKTMANLKG